MKSVTLEISLVDTIKRIELEFPGLTWSVRSDKRYGYFAHIYDAKFVYVPLTITSKGYGKTPQDALNKAFKILCDARENVILDLEDS